MATDQFTYYDRMVEIHQQRHPERGAQRVAAEVQDYMRRVAGLVPDCRSAPGAVGEVEARPARIAYQQLFTEEADLTNLNRKG